MTNNHEGLKNSLKHQTPNESGTHKVTLFGISDKTLLQMEKERKEKSLSTQYSKIADETGGCYWNDLANVVPNAIHDLLTTNFIS